MCGSRGSLLRATAEATAAVDKHRSSESGGSGPSAQQGWTLQPSSQCWLLTHPPTASMRSASCARVSGGCSTDCLLFMHLRNSAQRLAVVLKLKLNRLNAKSSSLEPHRCGPAFACSSAMTLSR